MHGSVPVEGAPVEAVMPVPEQPAVLGEGEEAVAASWDHVLEALPAGSDGPRALPGRVARVLSVPEQVAIVPFCVEPHGQIVRRRLREGADELSGQLLDRLQDLEPYVGNGGAAAGGYAVDPIPPRGRHPRDAGQAAVRMYGGDADANTVGRGDDIGSAAVAAGRDLTDGVDAERDRGGASRGHCEPGAAVKAVALRNHGVGRPGPGRKLIDPAAVGGHRLTRVHCADEQQLDVGGAEIAIA